MMGGEIAAKGSPGKTWRTLAKKAPAYSLHRGFSEIKLHRAIERARG